MSDEVSDIVYALEDSPNAIWLLPQCVQGTDEDRAWSDHDDGDCEDCGAPSVKYVRSDIVAADKALIADLAKFASNVALALLARVPK